MCTLCNNHDDVRLCSLLCTLSVGIPFAPMKDPWVVLKKQYLDERRREAANGTKAVMLDGSGWYMQSASRAVNQALGRIIRHKNDWGAIFLLDDR